MKFIKEMIKKKNQSSTLSEEIDADLQEMRAERQSDPAENVPDFTDLVAEINPDAEVAQAAEEDEEILAIFNEEQDEPTWEDQPESPPTDAAEDFHHDDEEDEEDATTAFSAPDYDEPVQDTVVPISSASATPQTEYEEPEFNEPAPETAADLVEEPVESPTKKIWDLQADEFDYTDTSLAPEEEVQPEPTIVEVPAPAAGRTGRRAGRVKTRLLGFEQSQGAGIDLFDPAQKAGKSADAKFPVGWIVVIDGPGRGSSFSIFNGVSQIGRGEDQPVKLDFGDNSISRSNHAAVAYDSEQCAFFLGHGGKANLVRLNDKPVLSTEELASNDLIRIGETTLKFIALCGTDFDWERDAQEDGDDAAIA